MVTHPADDRRRVNLGNFERPVVETERLEQQRPSLLPSLSIAISSDPGWLANPQNASVSLRLSHHIYLIPPRQNFGLFCVQAAPQSLAA